MIPEWPTELPDRIDRQGNKFGRGDGRLRTKTSSGPGKTRLRSRAVSDPVSGKMTMRRSQLDRFLAFFAGDIAEGTIPFLLPDPMGGLPILVMFGEEMPEWSNTAGDWWEVSLSLEKLRTGTIEPGLPVLPPGYAFVVSDGAYVLSNRHPVIVAVP